MVVKNIELVEQHLRNEKFDPISEPDHRWTRFYSQDEFVIDLSGDTMEAHWYPADDYSQVNTDFTERPLMHQVIQDVTGLIIDGKLPELIGRSTNPMKTLAPDEKSSATVPDIPVPATPAPGTGVEPPGMPMPVPSYPQGSPDKKVKNSNSGQGTPHQESLTSPDQNGTEEQSQKNGSQSSVPQPPPENTKGTKKPDLPFNGADVMNQITPAPKSPAPSPHLNQTIPQQQCPPLKIAPPPSVPSQTPLANPPALTDAQDLDRKMAERKTDNWLRGQGSEYKVHGNYRPDAASVQGAANRNKVSTEILSAVQTDEYAEVIVRSHFQGQYVDTIVHNDFKNSRQILLLEMAAKHPEIVEKISDQGFPVFKEGATITDKSNNVKNAMFTVMHTLLSDIQFSIRDCTTKASAAGQAKILNQDWRTDEEIQSEEHERALVETSKADRKA